MSRKDGKLSVDERTFSAVPTLAQAEDNLSNWVSKQK
jgi:hypothetical protein